MRIAIYGGSFNPPHVGHAMVASWVLWTGRADAVWLLPVGAHAFGKGLLPFERRRSFCEALARTLGPAVRVETYEGEQDGPSYTVETLEALSRRHPEHSFRLVLGADNVPSLPRWRRWEDLRDHFSPIVVGRAGHESPEGVPVFPGVSSTLVRSRIVEGASVDGLVPAAVLETITDADRHGWRAPG